MMVDSRPRLPTMYYNDSKNMKIQNEIVLFGNSTIKTGMPFNFFKNGGSLIAFSTLYLDMTVVDVNADVNVIIVANVMTATIVMEIQKTAKIN